MMNSTKNKGSVLLLGISLSLIIGAILSWNLFKGDRSFFLTGATSHGHYQIELACNACHTSAFPDKTQMQQACESCHANALERVSDSHPKSKFTDPRNSELLAKLDARYCVTCHSEHKPEITRKAGVTLASDFCFDCHQKTVEERASHAGFAFDSCANSGCHNFHDNSMLYEKFVRSHLREPNVLDNPMQPALTGVKQWLKQHKTKQLPDAAVASIIPVDEPAIAEKSALWQVSIHARTEVNCDSCHQQESKKVGDFRVVDQAKVCGECHEKQLDAFKQSQHGMRLSQKLTPMTTAQARLPLDHQQDRQLDCSSCHEPHQLDLRRAAVDACLQCHQDEHSQAYKQSKHYQLWQNEMSGEDGVGRGVSCATCHLPRIKKGKNVSVMHNQNFNLRPASKMLRNVCMNCHGLGFSLAALADPELLQNNFSAAPSVEHQTMVLVEERLQQSLKGNTTEEK